MIERPILFGGPMVRAIVAGTKTQTRRVVRKPQPSANIVRTACLAPGNPPMVGCYWEYGGAPVYCPHGLPGDRLWIRETWFASSAHDFTPPRDIPAGEPIEYLADAGASLFGKARSGLFMPRWATRGLLTIREVRVERLQEISARDVLAEGAVARAQDDQFGHNPVSAFDGKCYMDLRSLWAAGWDSINSKRCPWASNPWVWVIQFSKHGTLK